jgi:hypothetical protein
LELWKTWNDAGKTEASGLGQSGILADKATPIGQDVPQREKIARLD